MCYPNKKVNFGGYHEQMGYAVYGDDKTCIGLEQLL